jgi:hypothetical protein
MKKLIKYSNSFFIITIFLTTICSCYSNYTCSIQRKHPVGSELSSNIILKVKQIVPYQEYLLLLIDDTERGVIDYNPYMLVFDSLHVLHNSFFLPVRYVEKTINDTIFGIINDYARRQCKSFEKRLPEDMQFMFSSASPRSMKIFNKVVDSIKTCNNNYLWIYFRFSENPYEGFNIQSEHNINEIFTQSDSLYCRIEELLFNNAQYSFELRSYGNTETADVFYIGPNRYLGFLQMLILTTTSLHQGKSSVYDN